ncbi:MAG: Hsp20/alpha crystallin family protein [Mycobacterium leprae]
MQNPAEGLGQLQQQLGPLGQVLGEDFWRELQQATNFPFAMPASAQPQTPLPVTKPGAGPTANPPLEIYLTLTEVVVCAGLPGLSGAEHVRLSLTGPKELLLEAFLPPAVLHGTAIRKERFAGLCSRRVTLPAGVLPDSARAHYADGILEIHLKRAEAGQGEDGIALLRVNPA